MESLPELPVTMAQLIYHTAHMRSVNLLYWYKTAPIAHGSTVNSEQVTMARVALVLCLLGAIAVARASRIHSGDQLVSQVLMNCADMNCVKTNVLSYLDTKLNINEDARELKVWLSYKGWFSFTFRCKLESRFHMYKFLVSIN